MRRLAAWLCVAGTVGLVVGCGQSKPPPDPSPIDSGTLPTETCLDNDGDRVPGTGACQGVSPVDCDDTNANIHPGATETCNAIDDDCNDKVDDALPINTYYRDDDGDGYGTQKMGEGCAPAPTGTATKTGDCDDDDAAVLPGAAEVCNGVDDDCNGSSDDGLTFQNFYTDSDGDGYGDAAAQATNSCQGTLPGKVTSNLDCNDRDPTIKPGALELCNKVDDNCDGQIDNGITYQSYYPDLDGDGFGDAHGTAESSCQLVPGKVVNSTDCNDNDPTVHPGAPEVCNGIDDNCNGQVDDGLTFVNYHTDKDGDGYGAGSAINACKPVAGRVTNNTDCNDNAAGIHPTAPEACNGIDDDCDSQLDNGLAFTNYYTDADGDGHGAGAATSSCKPIAGKVTVNGDCSDTNAGVHPGATEICNSVDDNCNGQVDDGLSFTNYYPDADGDGYGASSATAQSSCVPVPGKVTNNTDCDDTRSFVHPGGTEVCNSLDDNCNSQLDEGLTFTNFYPDVDGDGYGQAGAAAQSSCAPVTGKVTNNTDCNDNNSAIHPGASELCNSVDDNCNGQIDDGVVTQNYYPDNDGDGYGAAGSTPISSCSAIAGRVTNNTDCNDGNVNIRPGKAEVCNSVDDDCNGQVDDGLTFLSYYPDLDSDGYGASGSTAQSSCAPVGGKVTNNTDCNDGNSNVNPGKAEVCNSVDDNCNAQTDEGLPTQSYYPDADGDGYGMASGTPLSSCGPLAGRVTDHTDCDDSKVSIHPGASETCNGLDDNCDATADEGNPGGGASCNTGQFGVCAQGTVTCQTGALTCLRNVNPGGELCNALDDDCDGSTDETFTNKGQSCSVGVGVCQRGGNYVCSADGSGTVCSATPGPATAPSCDGLDNDCDGVVDEPYLDATANVTAVQYTDLEVAPYYYSAGSCAGGANGTGTDALSGGMLVLGVGANGILAQPLSATGDKVGTTVSVTGLPYTDVAVAQSGDGFVVAGIWYSSYSSTPLNIDLYFLDATGTRRAQLWSQFQSGAALDSLRLVRGNGRRVTVVWRDSGAGVMLARVEPYWDGTAWSIRNVGGTVAPITSSTLVASTTTAPGLGADSTHADWGASQTCVTAATLRRMRVSYLPAAASQELRYFDVDENGGNKAADTTLTTVSGSVTVSEPDVAYFQNGGLDHWAATYIRDNSSSLNSDLYYWLSTTGSATWAYLAYATENGADSIRRARVSVTGSHVQLTALRYVADASGLKRQMMSRRITYAGAKAPSGQAVELSATSGACGADANCRPGNKDGLVSWSAVGKAFYAGSGASPAGGYQSTLTCQ